jgi:hypothetical protein
MADERFDLNKLLAFAKQNGVSISIYYWESSNELEIEVTSAAQSERFYMKRVPTVDYFIEKWNEHVSKQSGKE